MYKTLTVLIFIGLSKGLFDTNLKTYSMNRNCNGTLDFGKERTYVAAVSFDQWPPTDRCVYTVQANGSKEKFMFYFEYFHIDCSDGSLEMVYLTDNNVPNLKNITGLLGPVCDNTPNSIYVAPARFLRLTFQQKWSALRDRVYFTIIFTLFQNGPCDSLDFTCDNGRCINKNLTCNEYNPCGDYSDCPADLPPDGSTSAGGIPLFIVILMTMFGIFVSIALPIYCASKCEKERLDRFIREFVASTRGNCNGVNEWCSKGCARFCDCCAITGRGVFAKCCNCWSSARNSKSSGEVSEQHRTVSIEVQTDRLELDELPNIPPFPPVVTDDTDLPPSYEAAIAVNTKPEGAPPSYGAAMEQTPAFCLHV